LSWWWWVIPYKTRNSSLNSRGPVARVVSNLMRTPWPNGTTSLFTNWPFSVVSSTYTSVASICRPGKLKSRWNSAGAAALTRVVSLTSSEPSLLT
jgi:hypothetical protein